MMASLDCFDIVVDGVGAHGALPHQGVDPVYAAAQVITALQSIVSRNVDPLQAAVVSVTKIHGGDAHNIIPGQVLLGGGILGRVAARAAGEQDLAHVEGPAQDQVAVWERRVLVRVALRRLGGRCEQLLTALFLAPGCPNYETLAQEMGMKIGSIGPTRARCFQKLEQILKERYGVAEVVREIKPTYTKPAPGALLERLGFVDGVIEALAD